MPVVQSVSLVHAAPSRLVLVVPPVPALPPTPPTPPAAPEPAAPLLPAAPPVRMVPPDPSGRTIPRPPFPLELSSSLPQLTVLTAMTAQRPKPTKAKLDRMSPKPPGRRPFSWRLSNSRSLTSRHPGRNHD